MDSNTVTFTLGASTPVWGVGLEYIIGGAAVIVAICALGLAVYEGRANRRHHRMSVTPHITSYRGLSREGFRFELRNVGIGPAIFTRIAFGLDGKSISDVHNSADLRQLCNEQELPQGGDLEFTKVREDSAGLNAGESICLISCTAKQTLNDSQLATWRATFKRITVSGVYRSLYNEEYSFKSLMPPRSP